MLLMGSSPFSPKECVWQCVNECLSAGTERGGRIRVLEQRNLLSGSSSWVREEQCSSAHWKGRLASRTRVPGLLLPMSKWAQAGTGFHEKAHLGEGTWCLFSGSGNLVAGLCGPLHWPLEGTEEPAQLPWVWLSTHPHPYPRTGTSKIYAVVMSLFLPLLGMSPPKLRGLQEAGLRAHQHLPSFLSHPNLAGSPIPPPGPTWSAPRCVARAGPHPHPGCVVLHLCPYQCPGLDPYVQEVASFLPFTLRGVWLGPFPRF